MGCFMPRHNRWVDGMVKWLVPVNLRRMLQLQGALDSILAFAFTLFFLVELVHPGTFSSKSALLNLSEPELRRYLAFYLWYAFMYLAQLTVSLLMYMDVRNVKYNVNGRRRTIFLFLIFSPTLWVNLILSAANVMYFPWSPLGLFYVLHTLFVAPYWLHAFRYYRWLGDGEFVHFESPLVRAIEHSEVSEPPNLGLEVADTSEATRWPGLDLLDDLDESEPQPVPVVRVARLLSIPEPFQLVPIRK